jgi:hypothetical protein
MKLSTAFLAAAAAMVVSMPTLAHASSISMDATYYNRASASDPYNTAGQFATTSDPTSGLSVSDGGASASTNNHYGQPSVSARASSVYNASAGAESDLTYYFTINGPGTSTAVQITASGNVSATGSGFGAGFLTIGPAENASTFVNEQMSSGPSGTPLISLNDVFNLTVGVFYRVSMSDYVVANDVGTASVFLDPYIAALDPLYSITTSAGVGNGAAVTPIPAALPLFATALGGLGFVAGRRRKNTQAAA